MVKAENPWTENDNFASGELIVPDFTTEIKQEEADNDKEDCFAVTLVVEGVSYALYVYPKGIGAGADTHISVGVNRYKLPSLNIDTDDEVTFAMVLLHASGESSKNFRLLNRQDCKEENDLSLI